MDADFFSGSDGLPAGIDSEGSDPPWRVAWACTCQPSPMPIEASQKGGVAPFFGRKLRSGVAAPAAVPQLQDRQAHKEALART